MLFIDIEYHQITSLATAMLEQPKQVKAEIEHEYCRDKTPLWMAARNENLEIVHILLAHKANTKVNKGR
jgi:hypothetical protein